MRKFIVVILSLTLFTPINANANIATPKSEVELAIEKTQNYVYSGKGSITINSEDTIFGGDPTHFEYIRDVNGSDYMYNEGNKHRFIRDAKRIYVHSSYLLEHKPFDKLIPEKENVMYLIPEKFNNYYLYGNESTAKTDNPNGYFRYLGIRNYINPDSDFKKNEDGSYSVLDNQAKRETFININSEGFITELIIKSLDKEVPVISEKYSYTEIENVLLLFPEYDYKNIDLFAKTDKYNSMYYSSLMKDNLSFIYRMSGIEAKRMDPKTGTLLIKNITIADIKIFLSNKLKFWYSSSNSLTTDKGYKQFGSKIQQSLKGYNNKVYTGCLSKKGNELRFILAKC